MNSLIYFINYWHNICIVVSKKRVIFIYKKIAQQVVIISLFLVSIVFAAEPKNDFFISNQSWGNSLNLTLPSSDSEIFTLNYENKKTLFHVSTHGRQGLVISTPQTNQTHHIPLPSSKISKSKTMIFISPLATSAPLNAGFYILRISDLKRYAFKTNLPLFYIPTDLSLGNITDIVATHTQDVSEDKILFQTDKAKTGIVKMDFPDIEDLIKAQLINMALAQLENNPNLSELNELIESTQDKFKTLYESLHAQLKQVGGNDAKGVLTEELQAINWQSATPDELAQALLTTEENDPLAKVKQEHAKQLNHILTEFHTDYDQILQSIDLDFSSEQISKRTLIKDTLPPSQIKEHEQSSILWYGGVIATTVFVGLVLPKIVKKPFSQMAADYSIWHNQLLNRSWVRFSVNKLFPNYLKTSNSRLAHFIRTKLGPQELKYSDLIGRSDQFRRAFWQLTGGTLAVIGTEFLVRPVFRQVGEADAENAIFLNQPFSEMHSLWIQKNVLYRVVSNQVVCTISATAQLAVLEKEYLELVKKVIVDSNLESTLSHSFTVKQRRQFIEFIHKDLQHLDELIESKVKASLHSGVIPSTLTTDSLALNTKLREIRSSWTKKLHQLLNADGKQLTIEANTKLHHLLGANLQAAVKVSLERQISKSPTRIGILRKSSMAISKALFAVISKTLGKNAAEYSASLTKQTKDLWGYALMPRFWNAVLLQTAFRGSFNLTYFTFTRLSSLFWTTPLYISSYKTAKSKLGISTNRGEFLYGVAYGLISGYVYGWIMVNLYEKPLAGTVYDIEFSKYFSSQED